MEIIIRKPSSSDLEMTLKKSQKLCCINACMVALCSPETDDLFHCRGFGKRNNINSSIENVSRILFNSILIRVHFRNSSRVRRRHGGDIRRDSVNKRRTEKSYDDTNEFECTITTDRVPVPSVSCSRTMSVYDVQQEAREAESAS